MPALCWPSIKRDGNQSLEFSSSRSRQLFHDWICCWRYN